jgi:hypothetical protein
LNKLDEVPSLIKGMDRKVDDSIQFIKELKMEKENINVTSLKFEDIQTENKEDDKNELWEKFLNNNSLSYLLFLFALSLSFRTKKPFSFDEYIKLIKGDEQYLFGGKVIFTSLGIIVLAEKNKVWNVLTMNDFIIKNIRDVVYHVAKEMDKEIKNKYGDLPNFEENHFTPDIKIIEEYYK